MPKQLLYGELKANGIRVNDLARKLDRSQTYVSDRMTVRKPWGAGRGIRHVRPAGDTHRQDTRVFPRAGKNLEKIGGNPLHCKLTVRSPDEERDETLELDTDGMTYRRIKRTYHDAGYAIISEECSWDIPSWVWLVVAAACALCSWGGIYWLAEAI